MTATVANLAKTFAVISPEMSVTQKDFSPTFYQELDSEFVGFHNHLLVAQHCFSADWGMWEIHPHGDEVVVLLSGAATMVVRTAAGETSKALSAAGDYIVIPKNHWHTANVSEPTSLLFITPGEATDNQQDPVSEA